MAKTYGGIRENAGGRPKKSEIPYSELAIEALDYYADGNGYGVSYALRNDENPYGEDALLMKGLDEATSRPLNKDYTLYRGVSAESILGKDVQFELVRYALIHNDNSKMCIDALGKAKTNALRTHTDKGYVSTSTRNDIAERFGTDQNVVLKIKADKGTKGIDFVNSKIVDNTHKGEKEVLLARGLHYKVKRLYAKNGIIYADATIV